MISSRRPLSWTWQAASKPPIQNESKTCGGLGGPSSGTMRERFLTRLTRQLGVQRERLRHHLIHVVVLVGCQPAYEVHAFGGRCEHLIFPVQLGVLASRNRVV